MSDHCEWCDEPYTPITEFESARLDLHRAWHALTRTLWDALGPLLVRAVRLVRGWEG